MVNIGQIVAASWPIRLSIAADVGPIFGNSRTGARTTFLPYKAIAAIPHKGLGYTCDSYHGGVSFALHSETIWFDF